MVAPGGEERGLVDEIREVGARKAGRAARDDLEVDVVVERDPLRTHLENALPALKIGPIDHDLPVEPAGPEESRVENVGPVRRCEEDHPLVRLEAVHLDEELVQRLLALVVAASHAGAAHAADGVELVDEDDARRVRLPLLEEVAHPGGADAHEHLDEVGAADGEEGSLRLAGHGAGEQRLAGPRRSDDERALRDPATEALELLRLAEELDDLLQLDLRLRQSGDVVERDLRAVLGEKAGAALAEAERPSGAGAAAHGTHDEDPEGHDDEKRQRGEEDPAPVRRRWEPFDLRLGVLLRDDLEELRILEGKPRLEAEELDLPSALEKRRRGDQLALELALDDADARDVPRVDLAHEARVGDVRLGRTVLQEELEGHDRKEDEYDPREERLPLARLRRELPLKLVPSATAVAVALVLLVLRAPAVLCHAGSFPAASRGRSGVTPRSGDLLVVEHGDVREVPIPLREIEPVADHELVRDHEPDVVEVEFDLPAAPPVEERADP